MAFLPKSEKSPGPLLMVAEREERLGEGEWKWERVLTGEDWGLLEPTTPTRHYIFVWIGR